jgi:hypothetical protein
VSEAPLEVVPHRTLVDGVPVYWLPSAGESTITIMFRVGRVDEAFAHMGVTHVIEHLALNAVRHERCAFNGRVSRSFTEFMATGTPDELVVFAAGVCASLRQLPLERIKRELGVLGAEARSRQPDLLDHVLLLHCGYTAHGRVALPELGLGRLCAPNVTAWAAERFTRENAVVWIAGELPPTLRLELPAGARMPVPEASVIPTLHTPSSVVGPPNGVGLSALVPWSLALWAGALAAGQHLHEKLRFQEGISYQAKGDARRLSAGTAHFFVTADCTRIVHDRAAEFLCETMARISTTGQIAADLQPVLDGLRRFYSSASPQSVRSILEQWSTYELLGVEAATMASWLNASENLKPDDVAEAITVALQSSLLLMPQGCSAKIPSFPRQKDERAAVVPGRIFKHATAALFNLGAKTNYVSLGDTGVSRIDERGNVTTVLFKSCAGLLKSPNGDRRIVIGEDR